MSNVNEDGSTSNLGIKNFISFFSEGNTHANYKY
jgi:hypothetical protein